MAALEKYPKQIPVALSRAWSREWCLAWCSLSSWTYRLSTLAWTACSASSSLTSRPDSTSTERSCWISFSSLRSRDCRKGSLLTSHLEASPVSLLVHRHPLCLVWSFLVSLPWVLRLSCLTTGLSFYLAKHRSLWEWLLVWFRTWCSSFVLFQLHFASTRIRWS